MLSQEIRRGDIFYVYLFDKHGSEQESGRPAVIVSNDMNNEFSSCVEICYLTLQSKKTLPTHVFLNSGKCVNSTILCEQIHTVSKEKLGDYIYTLTDIDMDKINRALLVSLGISATEDISDSNPIEIVDRVSKNEVEELKCKHSEALKELRHYKEEHNSLVKELNTLKSEVSKTETYKNMFDTLLDKVIREGK